MLSSCKISRNFRQLLPTTISALTIDNFLKFLVGKDGDVCISILHEPGEDKFGYERPEERWLPVHTVETILISVISMINEPNDESPANVDAAVSKIVLLQNVTTKYD